MNVKGTTYRLSKVSVVDLFPDPSKYIACITKQRKWEITEFLDALTIQNDVNGMILVNDISIAI
jgi:hypothetical protein